MNRLSVLATCALLCGFGVALADDTPSMPDSPTSQPAAVPASQPSTSSGAIQATDTAAIIEKKGKFVTVEGVVVYAGWSTSGKVMNVKFKDGDKEKGLLCSAFEKSKERLDAAFNGNAGSAWKGAKIQVTGKVEIYDGKIKEWVGRPEITIQNPEQIKIVEPARAPESK